MSKKLREKILFVVTFVAIFVVPNFIFHYFNTNENEIFYRRLAEDNEICRQRAKEDSRETVWCDEIKKAATLTYQETRNSNVFFLLIMFLPLLFILVVSLYSLKKQVDELKAKIDV